MLPRKRRLTRALFDKVRASRLTLGDGDVSLRFTPTFPPGRFSVVVPKTAARSAVLRNKIRRIVYGVLGGENLSLNGIFYVKKFLGSTQQIKNSVRNVLKTARNSTTKSSLK